MGQGAGAGRIAEPSRELEQAQSLLEDRGRIRVMNAALVPFVEAVRGQVAHQLAELAGALCQLELGQGAPLHPRFGLQQ